MSVKEYSLKRDGPTALAPNLRVREFACGDGSDAVLIDQELVIVLQCIREHFGKPLHITSGYRTASHNAAVGGSKSSQHLLGRAADIQVKDTPPEFVAQYAETLLPNTGGIGLYPKKSGRAKGWVHVDVRKAKARWKM